MDTLDGFNHQLQDDALSKILSNVMTRDRTAKVTADLSNILSPQKVSFLDENEKLERKWVSPSKKKHVDIDTDNIIDFDIDTDTDTHIDIDSCMENDIDTHTDTDNRTDTDTEIGTDTDIDTGTHTDTYT